MLWVLIAAAAAAGLYALHRLAIYLEDWGYIYYRRKRPTSGGSPVYCLFQEMIQPQIRHVIEVEEQRQIDSDVGGSGDLGSQPSPSHPRQSTRKDVKDFWAKEITPCGLPV